MAVDGPPWIKRFSQAEPAGIAGSATLRPLSAAVRRHWSRQPSRAPMIRILAIVCAMTLLAGCSQYRLYKCVRDMVNNNEPYLSQAERDDSESLARQACRERAEARGN
jgi:hypothetical protein